MLVRDLMTEAPETIDAEQRVADAAFVMRTRNIRHLPVVRDGKLVGMLSDRDVFGWLTPRIATEDEQEGEAESLYYLIEDVMSDAPAVIESGAPAWEAADLMVARRISALPVVDGEGALVGIVSVVDFVAECSRRLKSEAAAG